MDSVDILDSHYNVIHSLCDIQKYCYVSIMLAVIVKFGCYSEQLLFLKDDISIL